jgi:predicted anti-sigma-YlaC factor YlaD
MDCNEVRLRLVAWRDGELGTSEAALVQRHLGGCPECRGIDRRLAESIPRAPSLLVPAAVLARLERATDIQELTALPVRSALAPPAWMGLLHRRTQISIGALVALMLLAGSLGWGVSSIFGVARGPKPSVAGVGGNPIPAEQFSEAAYEPPDR